MAKSSTDYRENVALGELSQVNVSDGQEVKAGDILLTYTCHSTTYQVKNLRSKVLRMICECSGRCSGSRKERR